MALNAGHRLCVGRGSHGGSEGAVLLGPFGELVPDSHTFAPEWNSAEHHGHTRPSLTWLLDAARSARGLGDGSGNALPWLRGLLP